jgi:hypothetical protein
MISLYNTSERFKSEFEMLPLNTQKAIVMKMKMLVKKPGLCNAIKDHASYYLFTGDFIDRKEKCRIICTKTSKGKIDQFFYLDVNASKNLKSNRANNTKK